MRAVEKGYITPPRAGQRRQPGRYKVPGNDRLRIARAKLETAARAAAAAAHTATLVATAAAHDAEVAAAWLNGLATGQATGQATTAMDNSSTTRPMFVGIWTSVKGLEWA